MSAHRCAWKRGVSTRQGPDPFLQGHRVEARRRAKRVTVSPLSTFVGTSTASTLRRWSPPCASASTLLRASICDGLRVETILPSASAMARVSTARVPQEEVNSINPEC